jgi:hypothetical protein
VATDTEAGAVSNALLLENATAPPPVFVSVTVQLLDAPLPNVAGAQTTELMAGGAVSAMAADRDNPFNDAVTVAAWSLAITPALAEKIAVLAPEATETDAGTVTSALLLESATVPPLDPESETVQVLEAPELNDDGVQAKPVTIGNPTEGDVTVPPVPLRSRACPSGEAEMVSVIPNAVVAPAEGDSVTLITATTPFWMVFAFNPARMHL